MAENDHLSTQTKDSVGSQLSDRTKELPRDCASVDTEQQGKLSCSSVVEDPPDLIQEKGTINGGSMPDRVLDSGSGKVDCDSEASADVSSMSDDDDTDDLLTESTNAVKELLQEREDVEVVLSDDEHSSVCEPVDKVSTDVDSSHGSTPASSERSGNMQRLSPDSGIDTVSSGLAHIDLSEAPTAETAILEKPANGSYASEKRYTDSRDTRLDTSRGILNISENGDVGENRHTSQSVPPRTPVRQNSRTPRGDAGDRLSNSFTKCSPMKSLNHTRGGRKSDMAMPLPSVCQSDFLANEQDIQKLEEMTASLKIDCTSTPFAQPTPRPNKDIALRKKIFSNQKRESELSSRGLDPGKDPQHVGIGQSGTGATVEGSYTGKCRHRDGAQIGKIPAIIHVIVI